MKNFIQLLLVLVLFASCAKKEVSSDVLPGDFAHAVYFWLKNPDSQDDRAAFEQSLFKFLEASEFIVRKHVGRPAATTHRDVVDGSYTYSLLLTFKNAEDESKYQEEAVHLQFIDESKHLWTKVLVYDSENILE